MDCRPHLSDLELDIDLRATALGGFTAALAASQQAILDRHDEAAWVLGRDSDTIAEILATHRRILERFLVQHAETLRARVEAEIESTLVTALAESDALAVSATVLDRAAALKAPDRRSRSRSSHPSIVHAGGDLEVPVDDMLPGGQGDDGEPMGDSAVLDAIDSDALFGTSPSLQRSEQLFDGLLAEWARSEHDEARALVDDAHARAAVLLHLADDDVRIERDNMNGATADADADAAPDRSTGSLGAELSALLAGSTGDDADRTLTRLAGSLDDSPSLPSQFVWHDDGVTARGAVDSDLDPSDSRDQDGSIDGQLALTDEQLEIAFADFWSGDIARQALDTLLAVRGHASSTPVTGTATGATRPTSAGAKGSTLVAGITPIIAIAAAITLLMAIVG